MGMKKICLIISIVLISMQVSAQNRRTFIVLQDNSGSYYNSANSDINHIQNKLADLFSNKNILNKYSLISQELEQGELFFDPTLDKIHFYWFVADQADNVDYYFDTDDTYKKFEEYFLTPAKKYSQEENVESYFRSVFSDRPVLKSAYNGYGISTYSLTSFAYPLCIDVLPTEYSKEYIVVLISDFKAGSTFGNKQDEKIFRDAFRNKAQNVLDRVAHLNSQFVKIDLGEYYKDAGYNSIIGFYAFKIRPNAGAPNPENIDVRIDSDIHFEQEYFGGDSYRIEPTKVVFNHSKNLSIDNVFLEFSLPNGTVVRREITPAMNESNGIFTFNSINDITLPDIINSFKGTIDLRYLFNTSFIVDEANQQSIKYTFETNRTIDNTNFTFQTKLSPMEISFLTALLLLLVLTLAALILLKKGKPIGILLRFNPFNNTYENTDFSPTGKGKLHTDYREWTTTDEEAKRFVIRVEGRYDYLVRNKWYNWKENTGYPIRIWPTRLECPEGFSAFISSGIKTSNNPNVPIEIDTAFSDSKFAFSIIFNKNDDTPITEPLLFSIAVDVYSMNAGFLKKFVVSKQMTYQFHIGPDLGETWIGIDPGTTGSCIAVATDSTDLTIEKDDDSKDKIYPSELLIISKDMKTASPDEIRGHTRFGFKSQAVANEDPTKGMYKFVSIKKLLGYNADFSLGTNKKGDDLTVNSNLLSTLLIECLMQQQKEYIELNKEEYNHFLNESGDFAPKRAVIAIPNNFTASKIQQLKECFFSVKNQSIRELRFIYEAEAILVNYINSTNANLSKMESPDGENVFIYDMGGATINATIANVKRLRVHNEMTYDITIISKLGYGVGGDTIDYAYLQWIFSKKDEYPILSQNNPFGSNADVSMPFRRQLKKSVLVLKKETINYYNNSSSTSLIDRGTIEKFNDFRLKYQTDNDPFEHDIKKGDSSFLHQSEFQLYVWDNINSIVEDVVTICKQKEILNLDTVIMSGRSSHFPRVKELVEAGIKKSGYKPNLLLLSLEESKSAVAKGACYYGIQNRLINLHNRTTNGVFGVIQHTDIKEPAVFHKLIDEGREFDSKGEVNGSMGIVKHQGFDLDGKKIQFCQVMGVNPNQIIANNEKHKYTLIATLYARPFAVKSIQMSVDNKDKIICSVTDVNDDVLPYVQSTVNDEDIMTNNDEQYTFFVKQS